MPLLYDEIPVTLSGIISVSDITLPANGRQVQFRIYNSYGYDASTPIDIYLLYENKLHGPVVSGHTIESHVLSIIGKVFSFPYDAKAIVVAKGNYSTKSDKTIPFDYSIKSSMNVTTTAHFGLNFNVSFGISDTEAFVKEYLKGSFSPFETVSSFIKAYVKRNLSFIIGKLDAVEDKTLMSNVLPGITQAISDKCKDDFNKTSEFLIITDLDFELSISNLDQVLNELNRSAQIIIDRDDKTFAVELEERRILLEAQIEFKRELIRAIRDSFNQPVLPPELTQVIIAYVQSNPGITYNDMVDAFGKINRLAQRTSPLEVFNAAKQLGWIEGKK